tara:strand:+ start:10076 stop:10678 length:603 start_codon:yes stop_codon:yes gene_type:complete
MTETKRGLILIGGGGHCKSVIDIIELENKYIIIGILDKNIPLGNTVLGYRVIGEDKDIERFSQNINIDFLITIGQIKTVNLRISINKILTDNKCRLATVISPRAYVSSNAVIKKGSVIHHDALINAEAEIGENCIINTKALIEHGVKIGDFCHISTGVVVNGDSKIGDKCFIGSNATISNSITIKKNIIVSAGKFIKYSI